MKARATAIAVSVAALAAASAVPAAEYEIQLKGCATSDATVLDRVGDTVIGTNDTRGTIEANFTEPINGRAIHRCCAAPTSAPVAYEPERSGRPVWSGSRPRRDRRRFG